MRIQPKLPTEHQPLQFSTRVVSSQHFSHPHPRIIDVVHRISVVECCVDTGVKTECLVGCSFDVELQRILANLSDPLVCVEDLPKLTACSSGAQFSFLFISDLYLCF